MGLSKRQDQACFAVHRGIKKNVLQKPDTCELCQDSDCEIVAHHWQGYNEYNWLNVWWICASCNVILRGEEFHNGSKTKADARKHIVYSLRQQIKRSTKSPNEPRKKSIKNLPVEQAKTFKTDIDENELVYGVLRKEIKVKMRQNEVAKYLRQGLMPLDIAPLLDVSPKTIRRDIHQMAGQSGK